LDYILRSFLTNGGLKGVTSNPSIFEKAIAGSDDYDEALQTLAEEQSKNVAHAYLSGLEKLAASGGDVGKVASVASFFVSRVDATVDQQLEKTDGAELTGKTAIANAKVA